MFWNIGKIPVVYEESSKDLVEKRILNTIIIKAKASTYLWSKQGLQTKLNSRVDRRI